MNWMKGKLLGCGSICRTRKYVRANQVDVRFVDHKAKQVWAVEMSCPWIDNRAKKVEEKVIKYGPLLLELLKQQHPGYSNVTSLLTHWEDGRRM